MNLSTAIANALYQDKVAQDSTQQVMATADVNKPVFQLSYFPLTINPKNYANPHSNTNPDGDYLTLYAFRQLVDPIPSFSRFYSPSGGSTEMVYGDLIFGASVIPNSDYASRVISSAQRTYSYHELSNLDGIPGTWRPVYATPEDWYETTQPQRFRPIKIDLTNLDTKDAPFIVLGGEDADILYWRLENPRDRKAEVRKIDTKTKLQSLSFKCLEVTLTRPWLNFQFFQLQGWFLQGQPRGFCSTGSTTQNNGVLPLLPTKILIGTEIELTADWAKSDRELLQIAVNNNQPICLGPFSFNPNSWKQPIPNALTATSDKNTISSTTWHVVGWFSSLVPLSPQTEDPSQLSLPAPTPLSPANGTVFNHFPRNTTLQWSSVSGAASYTVEIDYYHACQANKWCSEVGGATRIVHNLTTTNYSFQFIGAQPGRWRVWAKDSSGRESPKSNWMEFRYTQ
ncbi:MAG: hypothetical protein VKL59_21745 [Nostocaceae cyanobacterium]|nr:hypothetical protein [Nostocaceae cyanobacterium]